MTRESIRAQKKYIVCLKCNRKQKGTVWSIKKYVLVWVKLILWMYNPNHYKGIQIR